MSIIILFHENDLFLSAYKLIVISLEYRNFGALAYDPAEKHVLNAISLVIEQ